MISHYLSTAFRHFRRHKLTTAINVVGLAIGLACFIAAFAVVTYLDGSDRQFATADRVYAISQRIYAPEKRFDTGSRSDTSPPVAGALRADLPALEAVARADSLGELELTVAGSSHRMPTLTADGDLLKIFPFEMLPQARQDALVRPRSVVLTKDAAIRLYGNTAVVGKSLRLQQVLDLTVTGVIASIPTPSQFDQSALSNLRFDALVSWDVGEELEFLAHGRRMSDAPQAMQWGRVSGPTYVLLPRTGLSLASLERVLASFPERHVPAERRRIANFEFGVVPAADIRKTDIDALLFRGNGLSAAWLIKFLAVLVLAIACFNCANLSAASATGRLKEVGLRRVMGARGMQVVGQTFVEVGVLAVAALCLALAALGVLLPWFGASLGMDLLPTLASAGIWFTIAIALLLVCLLTSCYPSLVMLRMRPAGAVRQKTYGRTGVGGRVLVAAQFAVTSLLLIALIVVQQQSRELRTNALSSAAAQTLVIRNGLFDEDFTFEALSDRLARVRGVRSVAAIDNVPWASSTNTGAISRSAAAGSGFISPIVHTVTPHFEETLGVRLVAGRTFDVAYGDDFLPGGYPTSLEKFEDGRTYNVVIDTDLAEQLGWQDPLVAVDQIVIMPFSKIGMRDLTVRIIGVVEHRPLRMVASGSTANLFFSTQALNGYPLVKIDTANVPETLQQIEAVWRELAPQSPLETRFVDEYFERSYQLFARITRVVTGVTVFAFVISVMGLAGMAIFIVSRRRHEMGVRKTLGATARQIVTLLLRDFAKPIAIANVAVWPLAYLAANAYLNVFSHRMTLTPVPFVASLVLTIAIAWVAVGGQAWRAARVKPAEVLRYE